MSAPVLWLSLCAVAAPELTLEAAVQTALEQSEVPRIAEARISRARAARSEAYALLFPTLDLSATYQRRAFEVARDLDGNRVVFTRQDALSGNALLSATLFDATKFPRIAASEDALESAKHAAEERRRNLAFETAEAFYVALAASFTQTAAERRVELADRIVADARARIEAGLVSRNSLNRTALELASARLARTRAESGTRLSRLDLGLLMARDVDGALAPPAQTARPMETEAVLIERAISTRPDLAGLRSARAAAEHLADEPWMRLFPSVGAVGAVRATNETGFLGQTFTWDVALTLSWNLFDGGVRYAVADQRLAEALEVALEIEALERRVATDVRASLVRLDTADAARDEAESALEAAQANHEEVAARFARGLASALEEADAAVSEFEAATALERERLAAALARLDLARAVGDWPLPGSK